MEQHGMDEFSTLIKQRSSRYEAPPELRSRIVALAASSQDVAQAIQPGQITRAGRSFSRWLQLGSAFALGVLVTCFIAPQFLLGHGSDPMSTQLVDSHVRSLLAGHLTEVLSTDQHTVKPWFAGKLSFTPPVHDFATAGFPLAGGRLDVANGRIVAALVYKRNQHFINVFEMPGASSAQEPKAQAAERGFNIVHWSKNGMDAWAVSDLNVTELGQFAQLQFAQ